jgi:hypothetical protein
MSFLGDFALNAIVHCFFNTHKADGTPITLAGTPTMAVYKDDGTTETATGAALTVDFDGKTGLHLAKITTTDAFYAAGHDYQIVIAAGTVDSISVAGSVVGSFSTVNRPVAVGDKTGFALTSAYDAAKTAAHASDIPGVAAIDAQLSGAHGAGVWGAGETAHKWSDTIVDTFGDPLEGCLVEAYSDSGYTSWITSGKTDATGAISLYFGAAGTYYLRATVDGQLVGHRTAVVS